MELFRILTAGRVTLLLTVAALHGSLSAATTAFRFVGQCTDCSGSGNGTLVLQDYTLGTSLTTANFVSFSYSSNLASYTLNASQIQFLVGSLPASLPAPAVVNIANTDLSIQFVSSASGFWCTGKSCLGDFGLTSTWSLGAPPPPIPAVTNWQLAGLAAALAAVALRLMARGGRNSETRTCR